MMSILCKTVTCVTFIIILAFLDGGLCGSSPQYCGDMGQCKCYLLVDQVLPIVDCSNGKLTKMPYFTDFVYETTKYLHMENNNLTQIKLNLSKWENLIYLNVENNPIECNSLSGLMNTSIEIFYKKQDFVHCAVGTSALITSHSEPKVNTVTASAKLSTIILRTIVAVPTPSTKLLSTRIPRTTIATPRVSRKLQSKQNLRTTIATPRVSRKLQSKRNLRTTIATPTVSKKLQRTWSLRTTILAIPTRSTQVQSTRIQRATVASPISSTKSKMTMKASPTGSITLAPTALDLTDVRSTRTTTPFVTTVTKWLLIVTVIIVSILVLSVIGWIIYYRVKRSQSHSSDEVIFEFKKTPPASLMVEEI